MTEQTVPKTATPAVTPIQAVITVIAIIPLIGVLTVMANMIGVVDFLFMGFLFLLYWAGIKGMAPREFVPALLGSLGGLGLAYLIHALPVAVGVAGTVAASALVALSIYLIVRGQAAIMINYAFMLLLTVGTSLAFEADAHYAAAAGSIILTAAYAGGLMLLGRVVSARSGKAEANMSV